MIKKFLLLLIPFFITPSAFSQYSMDSSLSYYKQNWLGLFIFQSYFGYEEPGIMTEKGFNGGLAGEIGFNIHPSVSISLEASNWDGRLHYNGATFAGVPVQTVTEDYVSDFKLYMHFIFDSFNLSVGMGQRHWLNDLVVSYRRRTQYQYAPIKLSYFFQSYYLSLEYDLWLSGKNTSYMSDSGGGRSDITVKQNSGSGYGLELGWLIPNSVTTKVFFKIHRWDVADSEVGFDGVDFLMEPKNNTLAIDLGLGLIF